MIQESSIARGTAVPFFARIRFPLSLGDHADVIGCGRVRKAIRLM
jgi:hypothetical protein